MGTENQGRRRHSVGQIIAVGLGAHLLNWMAIPLGYGLDLIPGMVLVFIAVLLFHPFLALLIAAFALIPTLWHWGIPYAGLIILLEIVFVLLLKQRFRTLPLPIFVLAFWATGGTLIWFSLSTHLLDLTTLSTALILIKQTLNDALAASLAALSILLHAKRPELLNRGSNNQVFSIKNIAVNAAVIILLVPGLIFLFILGINMREEAKRNITASLDNATNMIDHDLGIVLSQERQVLTRTLDSAEPLDTETFSLQFLKFHTNPGQTRISGSVNFGSCDKNEAETNPNTRHNQVGSERLDVLCKNAAIASDGAKFIRATPHAAGEILIWEVIDGSSSRSILFSFVRADWIFSLIDTEQWGDSTAVRVQDEQDVLLSTLGKPEGKPFETKKIQTIIRQAEQGSELHVAGTDRDEGPKSKMTTWREAAHIKLTNSRAIQGLEIISIARTEPIVEKYREIFFKGLVFNLLLLILLIWLVISLTRAATGRLNPYGDNLFRLSIGSSVQDLPSRIIEVNNFNDRIMSAAGRLKLSADRRKEIERRLRDLIHCSPAIIWQGKSDPECGVNFNYVTPSVQQLTGLNTVKTRAQILPSVHTRDRETFLQFDRDLTIKGFASAQYRIHQEDDSIRWVVEEGRAMKNDLLTDAQFSGMILDISELKHAEMQVTKQAKMASLGEMASGIAHELNQPLQVIQLASDNALDALATDTTPASIEYAQQRIERIQAQAGRASEIIIQMRNLARDEDIGKTVICLRDVVSQALALVNSKIENSGIEIQTFLPDSPLWIRAKKSDIYDLLINLLFNSRDAILKTLKDTWSGGDHDKIRHIKVEVGLEKSQSRVCIVVQDHAGGVSDNQLNHIVDPFFTTKDPAKNVGIGLSVAQWAVVENGGSLSVDNFDGGLRVSACFPLVEAKSDSLDSSAPYTVGKGNQGSRW